MPPKKKARVSQATSPDPEPKTPAATSPDKTDEQVLNDPWTDDEETGLFKGLMQWKPTGIHKHFRLLALHAWMLENNYIHPRNPHTRPAGIWAKLQTLYDLPALDAREDARQLSPVRTTAQQEEAEEEEANQDADVYSVSANKIENEEFSLPPDVGFEDMMWKARFPSENEDESEFELPDLNMADEPPVRFTPSFSIEPSEVPTPGSKKGKGGTKAKGKAGAPASDAGGRRRSTRNTESVADKEEDKDEEEEGEGEDEDEEGEEEDEDDEESGEDESQKSTPGPRRGRSSRATRGKSTARPKGKARGRGK